MLLRLPPLASSSLQSRLSRRHGYNLWPSISLTILGLSHKLLYWLQGYWWRRLWCDRLRWLAIRHSICSARLRGNLVDGRNCLCLSGLSGLGWLGCGLITINGWLLPCGRLG